MTQHSTHRHGGRLTRAASLALLGVSLAMPVAAQSGPGPDASRPGRRPGRTPAEMDGTLSLFFVHRARVEVGLDETQTLKILPLVEKMESARQDSNQRRGAVAQRLRHLAEDPAVRDEEVMAALRELDQIETEARAAQDRARNDILALLTPQQKARFVLFAHRIRGQIDRALRERRTGRGAGRPGALDGPTDGEPDDPASQPPFDPPGR